MFSDCVKNSYACPTQRAARMPMLIDCTICFTCMSGSVDWLHNIISVFSVRGNRNIHCPTPPWNTANVDRTLQHIVLSIAEWNCERAMDYTVYYLSTFEWSWTKWPRFNVFDATLWGHDNVDNVNVLLSFICATVVSSAVLVNYNDNENLR